MIRFYKLILLLLLTNFSCDDGDIITVDLDFDDAVVEVCGDIVFYKINQSTNESISIQLGNSSLEDILDLNGEVENQLIFNFNGTTNRLNYRTYSDIPDNPFCSDIPPSQLNITFDDESSSGSAILDVSLIEDDMDGIPAEFEDINGNGDLTDDDTDGDGLPNYIDLDDDGDNVPTQAEEPNFNEDNGLDSAKDSDGDGTPDYLDADDDGDGVLTRNEENSNTQDQNPLNDITFTGAGPDFLNPAANEDLPAVALITHIINQDYTIDITLIDFELANLIQDVFNFGEYQESDSRTFTPQLD